MRGPFGLAFVLGALALVWCGFFATLATPAAAQEVTPEDRARLEEMFEKITRDPTNLDLTYEYAIFASKAGDYEAAITAYERLLLFNPSLPRVKAELGVLYFRLGSFDTAKAYLEQALAEGEPPVEVRAKIDRFLAAIDERTSRHAFNGSASFGARFQTNANYGPDGQILVFDILADPGEEIAGDEDVNLFASVNGRYVYDFGVDSGDFFAAEANLYGSRQFEFTELDVEHLFLKAGPGFNLFPKDNGPVLLQPTVRATYVRLDDETYNFSYGLGWRADWAAFEETTLFVDTFGERREYYATDERENADTQDGFAWRVTLGASHLLNENVRLSGDVFAGDVSADEASEAYFEFGLGLGVGATVASPFENSEELAALSRPWSVSVSARYARRDHDAANNIVSAIVREDDEFRIDGTIAAPVADSWSVFLSLGYQDNRSTVINNEFQNFSAAIGASLRF